MTSIRTLLSDPTLQQKKVLEKLICNYTGLTKEQLITSYDVELTAEQLAAVQAGYSAYTIDKKPLEFIVGFVEFYKRRFAVDGRCLIPRPETEYMIEGVCDHVEANIASRDADTVSSPAPSQHVLIDVGTGCGVLGTSVLLENPGYFQRAYLTEYIDDTLSLAVENVAHYRPEIVAGATEKGCSTDVQLVKADLVDFLSRAPYDTEVSRDDEIILIANLPYIPDETFDTQTEDNVRKWEPRPAFVGGADGLDYYRIMFTQIETWYKETGLSTHAIGHHVNKYPITMFLEMMTWQVDILRKEFGNRMVFDEIKTFHFNIRIVKAVRM